MIIQVTKDHGFFLFFYEKYQLPSPTNMFNITNSLKNNINHSNPAQKMLKPAEKAQTFTQMLTTSQSPATGESKAQG